MTAKRNWLFLAAAAAPALAAAPSALAQTYPAKNVSIVVPWAPGGTTDVVARLVGEQLRQSLGIAVVVDNKPGANGTIGTELVARAAADGHTLLMATSSTHVVNPNLQKLPFDPVKDFDSITLVATTPFLLVVTPGLAAQSVRELVELARSSQGKLNFASYGQGSTPHLVAELFRSLTKVEMTHVPYKGSAPVLQALMAGEVNLAFDPLSASLPHVRAGKVRALGVTTAARTELAPELPTIAEGGVAGFEANAWYGLQVPKGTPRAVIDRLNADAVRYLRSPEGRKRLFGLGADVVANTPDEFNGLVVRELGKWRKVITDAQIKIQ